MTMPDQRDRWQTPPRPASWWITLGLVLLASIAVGAWGTSWLAGPRPLVGTARVIDGDTIDLCSGPDCQRIRLCGIDTPECGQPSYGAARRALTAIAPGEDLRCIAVGRGSVCDGRSRPSSHGRTVAQCFHSRWGDIAGEMVARGHACDLTQFSGGHYTREHGGRPCPPRTDR
jgi:micrococcal nuclease